MLLANAIDAALMRNQLAYQLSADMGADCYMDSRQVTLIYNGSYCGVYQLCEQIRIADNRVEIYDWEDCAAEAAKAIADSLKIEEEDQNLYREGFERILKEELFSDLSWLDTGVFVSAGLANWNQEYGTVYPTEFSLKDYLDPSEIPEPTGGVLLNIDARNTDSSLETAYHLPVEFADPVSGATSERLHDRIQKEVQTLNMPSTARILPIGRTILITGQRRRASAIMEIISPGRVWSMKRLRIPTRSRTEAIIVS